MWWFPGGLAVTLPCDRRAAIAALDAAINAAKRSIYVGAAVVFAVALIGVAIAASLSPPGMLEGPLALFLLVFIAFALLVPIAAYAQAKPWIAYLEELKQGLESGSIRVEDVCGKPIYWSQPRRRYP